jgi:hypothetical protein
MIHPQDTEFAIPLITSYTNENFSASMDTKPIQKYINKGEMTKNIFFGVLKV